MVSRPANPMSYFGWLNYYQLPYDPGEPAYPLAREIVAAKLPKKEFFEIIAMVSAIGPYIDPSKPVYDCCSGHGLLGMLLAFDARVPKVVVIDRKFPPNRARLLAALSKHRAGLEERLEFVESPLEGYGGFGPGAFVAAHACGLATEEILETAVRQRARFFVMTCCISRRVAARYGLPSVHGLEPEVNARRLAWARDAGYEVDQLEIDARITPFNVILSGWPAEDPPVAGGGLEASPLPARLARRRSDRAG